MATKEGLLRRANSTPMARTRRRHLVRLRNSFDFLLLEPGDLVLVANPTDPWPVQLTVFWSHVAIYTGGANEERAFVDAVNLPVRRVGRRSGRGLPWQRVRHTSLRMFRSYVDILVLRPDLPPAARRAAADFAREQVGKPFLTGRLWSGMIRPRGAGAGRIPRSFTCASLIWHAYNRQGLDLSSGLLRGLLLPWPSRLGHDRRLARVGGGTRYRVLRPVRGRLLLLAVRAWFRWALRSEISWRGEPDAEEMDPAVSSGPPPTPGAVSHQVGRGRR